MNADRIGTNVPAQPSVPPMPNVLKQPVSKTQELKFQDVRFAVSTTYNHAGVVQENEYVFNTEEQLRNFANGNRAVDRWGDCHVKSYYEHISRVQLEADVDVYSLYELAVELETEEREWNRE